MKRTTILCGLLAALGTSAVVWQQHSLSSLLARENADFVSNAATNLQDAEIEAEVTAHREQTKDLPKLRNEVGQLRTVRTELAAARAENVRLLDAKRTGAPVPREPPPGFISRERLANAGFATPEDAVQTFFWAMRESHLDLMVGSLTPEHRDRENFENLSPEKRAAQIAGFFEGALGSPRIKGFSDFAVVSREQISEDTVVLSLRSSVSDKIAKYRLKRFGTEWKIEDLPL